MEIRHLRVEKMKLERENEFMAKDIAKLRLDLEEQKNRNEKLEQVFSIKQSNS